MLFEDAGGRWLLRGEVIDKYNESGVPITWSRIAPFGHFFEKKTVVPPFSPSEKKTLVLPLKSSEENLTDLEGSIV